MNPENALSKLDRDEGLREQVTVLGAVGYDSQGHPFFDERAYEKGEAALEETMTDEAWDAVNNGPWIDAVRARIPDSDHRALVQSLQGRVYYHSGAAAIDGDIPDTDSEAAMFYSDPDDAQFFSPHVAAYRLDFKNPIILSDDAMACGIDRKEIANNGYDAAITTSGSEVAVVDPSIIVKVDGPQPKQQDKPPKHRDRGLGM